MKCDNFAYVGISVSLLDFVLFRHSCAHCHLPFSVIFLLASP